MTTILEKIDIIYPMNKYHSSLGHYIRDAARYYEERGVEHKEILILVGETVQKETGMYLPENQPKKEIDFSWAKSDVGTAIYVFLLIVAAPFAMAFPAVGFPFVILLLFYHFGIRRPL